ncbi:putative bifunctional diguanylate cyclase/phosphodiesterase [Ureibacillus sinduriensis]|uniref:Diguanylate cyclase n=1 Tax=Ureibacillus sinduriensis BLB-1 = JCM 15800 TaxID=1384057 RepID=A0A0A3IQ20_9BACL|nr:GGDEF and EAL domain-containing protein [Ureibacillus sinduriensis]KGR76942.1 diguanylate cyclase [Ureibacillus sinduriensis BLB-1 = JCM 15800]
MVINQIQPTDASLMEHTYEELKDIKAAILEAVILAVTDSKGIITAVNDRFCEISKYSRAELIGKDHSILNSRLHPEQFFNTMRTTIENGRPWSGEICNLAKDGSIYWVHTTIVPFSNENGTLYQCISIRTDITDQKNTQVIKHYENHDRLTGLPNRRLLAQRLNLLIEKNKVKQLEFAVFLIDINRFRHINDALGHKIGDLYLVEVAKRFQFIEPSGSSFYRLNGDEFVFLLEDMRLLPEMAAKLMGIFEKPFTFNNHEFYSTVSVGISQFPQHGTNLDNLMVNAELAMYVSKSRKGNQFELFKHKLVGKNDHILVLETKLRHALKQNLLELHYQPKMDLKTGKLVGMEALLRWNDEELGQIPPNEFIPFAEECGLISDIGEWVLKKTALQIKEWEKHFLYDLRVAVNISPLHFKEPDFVDKLNAIFEETKVRPEHLEIELTEMSMMDYNKDLINKIQEVKRLGLTVAIDDFGTGYSSLGYLKQFPVDTLKIDRSFIVSITEGESGVAMVAAIIALAQALKLKVVAEGVETKEQIEILKQYNCEYVQGYYFSRPLNVEDITLKIQKSMK